MILSTGLLGALACTGCTAFVAEEYPAASYASSAPIETTHAMRVAVPAPIGTPVRKKSVSPLKGAPELDVQIQIEQARNTLVEYGVDLPPTYSSVAFNGASVGSTGGYIIVSPFNEASKPGSLLSGFRSDILDIDHWSSSPGLRALRGQLGAQRLSYGTLGQQRYDAEISFAAPSEATGLNFDIGLVPSASYAQEGDFSVRRVGAEFRLGQDIDQRGNNQGLPSWYFFAAADGEAVIFNNASAGSGLALVNGIQLRDQVTVGDIQAGVNIRSYGTNFAFNYIRREVEYELNSETIQRNEDFGGITLTWRR